jgi:hypothetical protein
MRVSKTSCSPAVRDLVRMFRDSARRGCDALARMITEAPYKPAALGRLCWVSPARVKISAAPGPGALCRVESKFSPSRRIALEPRARFRSLRMNSPLRRHYMFERGTITAIALARSASVARQAITAVPARRALWAECTPRFWNALCVVSLRRRIPCVQIRVLTLVGGSRTRLRP